MKGFSLIELIVSIFLASLIILVFTNLFNFSIKTNEFINFSDKTEEASFVLTYLTNEINGADKIYKDTSKVLLRGYDNSLGFIIRKSSDPNEGLTSAKYTYIYYALKNDGLYRIALNTDEENINSKYVDFRVSSDLGINSISSKIESIDSEYLEDLQLINISIKYYDDDELYTTSIFSYGGDL